MIARDDRNVFDAGRCDQKTVAGISAPKDHRHLGGFKGDSSGQVRKPESGDFEYRAKPLCGVASAKVRLAMAFSQCKRSFPTGNRRYEDIAGRLCDGNSFEGRPLQPIAP